MSRRFSRFFLGAALSLGVVSVPVVAGPATVANAQQYCVAEWLNEGPFVTGHWSPAYEYDKYDTYSLWVRFHTLSGTKWRYQSTNCTLGPLYYQYSYNNRLEVCNAAGHFGCAWNGGWGAYLGLTTNGVQRLSGTTTPYVYYNNILVGIGKATLNLTYDPGI